MRSNWRKRIFKLVLLVMLVTPGHAQKEFFRSQQVFTDKQMAEFYSSLTMDGELVIFNANDYQLYAYHKKDGKLRWSYDAKYKSNIPVFVEDDIVYAGIYSNDKEQSAQLDQATGKLIKVLPFGPLKTKPYTRDGMLYTTAIYNYGCIVAYDLKKDSVTWSRFIAHGFSNQPYYQQNKIIASAESNNWVNLGFDGALLDTACTVRPDFFVEGISCVDQFMALSHDGREIKGKLADDIFGTDFRETPDIITTKNFTYIVCGDILTILSGKLKRRQQVTLSALSPKFVENSTVKLIMANDETAWLLYGDQLLQYHPAKKRLATQINLADWDPRSIVIDNQNIWLVSGKDGLLYGLSFEN